MPLNLTRPERFENGCLTIIWAIAFPIVQHYSSQDLATGLEETGKTGRFNEKWVVHLPQSTLNSKNFAQ
jgi:hypothetical protein